jgi:diadenosine tetraphosphate (Ap4A) HIT family hydrolase
MPAETADPSKCGICKGIAAIKAGTSNDFIAELPGSYVILGDAQYYRGYCILFARRHVTEMYLMRPDEARALFDEVRLVAEAIAAVTNPWKMNYECLGNTEAHVHWHLFPRYENDEMRLGPVWLRADTLRKIALPAADRAALMAALCKEIAARFPDARIAG